MRIGWRILTIVPLLGCESLSGVDDLEIHRPDAGASLPSGNGGSGGTGTGWGDGAVAAPDAPDCTPVEEELVAEVRVTRRRYVVEPSPPSAPGRVIDTDGVALDEATGVRPKAVLAKCGELAQVIPLARRRTA